MNKLLIALLLGLTGTVAMAQLSVPIGVRLDSGLTAAPPPSGGQYLGSGATPAPPATPPGQYLGTGSAPGAGPTPPALPPGLYVQVLDGMIQVTNPTGSQNFAPGQFGFTPSPTVPPIIVPRNPGPTFPLPPLFNVNTAPTAKTGPPKTAAVDCEVR